MVLQIPNLEEDQLVKYVLMKILDNKLFK